MRGRRILWLAGDSINTALIEEKPASPEDTTRGGNVGGDAGRKRPGDGRRQDWIALAGGPRNLVRQDAQICEFGR